MRRSQNINRYKRNFTGNFNRNASCSGENTNESTETERKPFRKRHPPHLKGKEIGLFYRDLKRSKPNNTSRIKPVGTILLSDKRKQQIETILKDNFQNLTLYNKASNLDHVKDSEFKKKYLETINGNIDDVINNTLEAKTHEELDEYLHQEFMDKLKDNEYKLMLKSKIHLPITERKKQLIDFIESNQVVLISGETGCGKTTQIPQFILDNCLENKKGSSCKIICTQPRRISAVSVAERVACERNESIGNSVGYNIRLERKLPRDKGSICFCTTGVVLKLMENKSYLAEISHLILDEIHERDIHSDFLITVVKYALNKRTDLKLILMSATLNSEIFSKYFNDCPHIEIPGFTYPVKEYYLEDVIERTKFTFNEYRHKRFYSANQDLLEFRQYVEPYVRNLEKEKKYSRHTCTQLKNIESEKLNLDLIYELLLNICQKEKEKDGAILIFLTGYSEISNLNNILCSSGKFPRNKFIIIPLHSQMPTVDQKQVFNPAPPGQRKIILSTNICETSITIDDVVFVIDCGKIKITNFDVSTNTQTLLPEWVSLANANQRRGRAGRVKPGVCFHLYSKARELQLERFQKPEILRKRLEDVILQAKILKLGKAEDFFLKLLNPPLQETLQLSLDLLTKLCALDENENLTPLGYHLARLPMSPQMGKMILLGAIFSCLNPILSITASLDFKHAFQLPMGKEKEADRKKVELSNGWKSDHLVMHQAIELFETTYNPRQFCREYFLSTQTLHLLQKMKKQYMEYLCEMKFVNTANPKAPECNVNSDNLSLVKAVICSGLYPNVCFYKMKKRSGVLQGLKMEKLEFHPQSILSKISNFESPLFVYHVKLKSSATFIHDATMIYPLPIAFFGYKCNITKNEEGLNIIQIHEGLSFKCSETTSSIILKLKDQLTWFLQHKISHPGIVNWNEDTNEIHLLKAIVKLITSEDLGDFESDSYEDDE